MFAEQAVRGKYWHPRVGPFLMPPIQGHAGNRSKAQSRRYDTGSIELRPGVTWRVFRRDGVTLLPPLPHVNNVEPSSPLSRCGDVRVR